MFNNFSDKFPDVSVIMAVFNGEAYLRETIDSILAQTYKDFEFVIVNDASTDNTRDIILSYSDERIKLFDNPENIGLASTLNRCLEEAKGKWIVRTDADDYHELDRIELQVKYAEENNLDICFCDIKNILPDGTGYVVSYSSRPWAKIRWLSLFSGNYGAHSSVCFKYSAILEEGGYNGSIRAAEDYDLWERCSSKGLKFGYLPKVLVYYRINEEGLSNTMKGYLREKADIISLRAMRRVWPELDENTANSLRWLLQTIYTPKADRSHEAGFKACKELIDRFCSHYKLTNTEKRIVWAESGASMHIRFILVSTWRDRIGVIKLLFQSIIHARSKYCFPIKRIIKWCFKRFK